MECVAKETTIPSIRVSVEGLIRRFRKGAAISTDGESEAKSMERKQGGGTPSLFAIIVAICLIWFGYTFCMQQAHLNEVADDRAVAVTRLEEARARNEALKAERDGLERPEYIEKVAREELGMTRSGEMPYIAPAK